MYPQNEAQIRRTGQIQAPNASAVLPSIVNSPTNPIPIHREHPQRRDAATLTEAGEQGKRKRTWDPGHRGRMRWQHSPTKPYGSEDDEVFKHEWGKDRHPADPVKDEEGRTREQRTNGYRSNPLTTKVIWSCSFLSHVHS